MIKSFRDKRAEALFAGLRVRQFASFEGQAQRRLNLLNQAESIHELMRLPSNRFEALRGDRAGQYSIRINQQWRICFRLEDGDAYDVEITDYHR